MRASAVSAIAVAACATAAFAQPAINGAVINSRLWNDDSDSVFTGTNNYAAQVILDDQALDGDGIGGEFANRHNWRLSADGGASGANFANGDSFSLFSDVTISGTGHGEAGLNLSPWWSQNFDGAFNLRTTDGEIAIFGGRLPFYSFTGDQGLNYVKGTTVNVGIIYNANGLSAGDPATVEYIYDDGTSYTSGPLPFDEGNPLEGFGSWGMLDSAQAGGYMVAFIAAGDPSNGLTAEFNNIAYIPAPASLALLGLGAFAARRRR